VDAFACPEGLLGHGGHDARVSEVSCTFNVVPALGLQLEEYASGNFNEPWFSLAFKNAEELVREDKAEILARAFQVNHERLMSRWPRFVELYEWSRPAAEHRRS